MLLSVLPCNPILFTVWRVSQNIRFRLSAIIEEWHESIYCTFMAVLSTDVCWQNWSSRYQWSIVQHVDLMKPWPSTSVLNINYSGYISRKFFIANIVIGEISRIFTKYRMSLVNYKHICPATIKQIEQNNTYIHTLYKTI